MMVINQVSNKGHCQQLKKNVSESEHFPEGEEIGGREWGRWGGAGEWWKLEMTSKTLAGIDP